MHYERADEIADAYRDLRAECYRLARENDAALMGKDAWLRFAIDETDLELWPTPHGIMCTGRTYSMQTMENEFFSFEIPYDQIRL